MPDRMTSLPQPFQGVSEGLTFDERGDLHLWLVWAIKPGQPQIIAVCTDETTPERYREIAPQIVPGAIFHVEEIVANHLFGRNDIQSFVYRKGGRHDQG